MADGAPQLHGSTDPFVRDPEHNILLELHGEIGDVEAGFAEADVIHEGTYFSPRVQHAHLETHGSIAWMEDGRLNVRTSSQSPSIAKVKLVPPVRSAPRPAPRVLQAGRRRFRRQAGGDRRGPRRAGHAGHRPAGELRIHPGGGVHHRLAPAPDDAHHHARGQGRRHAHRVPGPQRLQHRRLRQPRRRDAVRGGGRRRDLPLPQQEVRRLLGVHEHRAQRRAPRLRHDAAGVRGRVRHARAGGRARHGSAGIAPPQHRPPR